MNLRKIFQQLCLGTCLVFAAACPLNAQTATNDAPFTVTVEGTGDTRDLAIIQAVKQALIQTEGVKIDALETLVKSKRSPDGRIDEKIRNAVAGRIAGYEVLSATQNGTGAWTATLNVRLSKYRTPGGDPATRRKLAVLPFRVHKDYKLDGTKLNATAISERLAQRTVTDFTQSRRFAVVDRDFTAEYLRESNFLKSPNAPAAELIKVGQALGVDYLVVGAVEELSGNIKTVHQTLTNRDLIYYEGGATVSYRVLIMATRQIQWSDTIRLDLASIPGDNLEARFDAAATELAHQISTRTLENIYPIKIADIAPHLGEVILARGGNLLTPGDRFVVMNIAEKEIIDPDTGESLGRRESPVAVIELTRVEAKLSYAKIVQGDLRSLKIGDIVRRQTK
ncbi:MAG: hypothetical protein LBV28_01110 [Puniceicoccales bacterium]|jgi:TolB-like protein|nr:hypothetical protein [Puniceicoccales bacterium]